LQARVKAIGLWFDGREDGNEDANLNAAAIINILDPRQFLELGFSFK
jgi:hypothetical protein